MGKIKKGDKVVVITGKDKGREGTVLTVINGTNKRSGNSRVVVESVNVIKRHTKPTQEKPGGILEKEASIDLSNVAILNSATGKADKIGFKLLEDGRKVRVFKSTGEVVDV
jgi:large subunit ribosomal protein L24